MCYYWYFRYIIYGNLKYSYKKKSNVIWNKESFFTYINFKIREYKHDDNILKPHQKLISYDYLLNLS